MMRQQRRPDALDDAVRVRRAGTAEDDGAVVVHDLGRGVASRTEWIVVLSDRSISSTSWARSYMVKEPRRVVKEAIGGSSAWWPPFRSTFTLPRQHRPASAAGGARSGSGSGPIWNDVRGADPVRRRRPEERQREVEFLAQDRQRPFDTGLSRGRQGPVHRPADEHAAGPERERDRDVEAAPDAAVDPDLGATGGRLDDLGEDVDGRWTRSSCRAPWLLTTMASTPCSCGQARVLGGQDALEDEGERRPGADRREVVPGETRLELRLESGRSRWRGRGRMGRVVGVLGEVPERAGRSKPERRSRSR